MTNQDLSRFKLDRNDPQRAPRPRRWLIAGGGILIVAVAFFLLRGGETSVETSTVGSAYPAQGLAQLSATGYVVASRRAAVASKATGRLEWLGVEEGSRVKQGEVIARLENKDMLANVNQAQANVRGAQAKREQAQAEFKDAQAALDRAKDLLAKNFIAPSAFDTAQTRRDKAHAAVSAASADVAMAQAGERGQQVAYDYTLIRAPFDGVVLTKHANVGDVITPFAAATDAKGAVVTMADMDSLEVEVDVSESNLHLVAVNQPCEIQLDAIPGARFRGEVSRIVPTVDRTKATILVKVRFVDHDPRILPDMSAKVAFLSRAIDPAQNKPVIAVAQKALTQRDKQEGVFVVDQGHAQWVSVRKGSAIGDLVEIQSGLKGGQTVVINPAANLKDGARVKLTTK
jgi:HlyD family secretion protein